MDFVFVGHYAETFVESRYYRHLDEISTILLYLQFLSPSS